MSARLLGLLAPMILMVLVIVMEGIGEEQAEVAVRTMNIIAIIGVLLSIVIGLIIIQSVNYSLKAMVEQTTAIANGDLSQQINIVTDDEIGQLQKSLKIMQEKMKSTVMGIYAGTTELSGAAEQVAQGNTDLSQRTQEQASSLEEISSSMEEMTSTVNQNAENADEASDIALDARIQADKGSVVVHDMVAAMREIDASSAKIADILGVIDDIAFQTNLLALNAAVEAARAGDQGRGFAVVAGEVRNLAGRSAVAAKEIKVLIQESVDKVNDGTSLADVSAGVLNDIVEAVKKVGDRVSEISAASKEQAQGIGQVNQALLQMDEMTQGNAALVEEASATSEAVGAQAQHLIDIVSTFDIGKGSSADLAEVEVEAEPEEVSLISDQRPVEKAALPHRSMQRDSEADDEWKDF
ncbi:methyl-accepting chemotaxis protein [Pseudomonadota bacterium]